MEMATRPSHKPGKPRARLHECCCQYVIWNLYCQGIQVYSSSTRSSPENVTGGCQPILRVRPCRHRQHSPMRTARVRCAAQYGTITSRTPSGKTNGAYRTLWWPVLCQVIGPIAPTEPTVEWCPHFVGRWAFVTKRSSGDSSSRMVLTKERDSER